MSSQKKVKKSSLVTSIIRSLSLILLVTFASVLSAFEIYKYWYLVPSYIEIIEQENSLGDRSLSDCLYNVVSLKTQVYKVSNVNILKESDNKKEDFKKIVDENGLNSDLFFDIGFLYDNQYYGYYEDKIVFDSFDLQKVEDENRIHIIKSIPYDDGYCLLTTIKHDDIYSFYFLKQETLSSLIQDKQREGFKIVSMNETYVIISDNESLIGKDILELESYKSQNKIVKFNEEKYYLINSKLESVSLYGDEVYINTFIGYDYLFSQINDLEMILLLIIGITFIVTLIFTIIFTNRIVKPIKQLSKQVSEVDLTSDFLPKNLEKEPKNEIYILEKSYQDLLDRIQNLLQKQLLDSEKQRKLELDSLQEQINPHFLYNALDSIAWMAKIDKEKSIEEFVISLARFYRLSLHKGAKYITIQEEMDIIKYYLEIQLKRFPETFTFSLYTDPTITDQKTLKLILQPFVENIVKHAFNEISDVGKIEIKAELVDEQIVFTIKDNGCGFDTEIIKQKQKESQGGYGIHNVIERLKLEYKEKFEWNIDSKIGEGTTVIIKIPNHL